MPVEIREIIIKTEISSREGNYSASRQEDDFKSLKKLLLEECKKMIAEKTKKNSYKR